MTTYYIHKDLGMSSEALTTHTQTDLDASSTSTLSTEFVRIVKKYPNKLAVIDGNLGCNYSDLFIKASKLCQHLVENGVKRNDIIAIHIEPSIEYIIAILAISMAGGIYLPSSRKILVETTQLQFVLGRKIKSVIVSNNQHLDKSKKLSNYICIQDILKKTSAKDLKISIPKIEEDYIATLTQTSGTTSIPKYVQVTHANIVNLALNKKLHIEPYDVLVHYSNPTFDASLVEIWGALLNGARLVIHKMESICNAKLLERLLETDAITYLYLPNAVFSNIFKIRPHIFATLKSLFIGGEVVNSPLIKKLFSQKSRPKNIINVYGPTETTAYSTVHYVSESDMLLDNIPIGLPLDGYETYVLDENLNKLPNNQVGELFIGGKGVTCGYINNTKLNILKFIDNPFEEECVNKLYRTGDLVRMLDSGIIEYVGRVDDMVKIRGYRIELKKVEKIMHEFPHISQAAVLVHQTAAKGKYLVGYFTVDKGYTVKINELRMFLLKYLHNEAIPSFFISIDDMPTTVNGKIDKKQLSEMHNNKPSWLRTAIQNEQQSLQISPRNSVEKKIAAIFAKLLELEKVYVKDDFFELGGHSLLALRLIAQLEEIFSIKLSLNILYKYKTVEILALRIQQNKNFDRDNSIIELHGSCNQDKQIFMLHPIGGTAFCYMPLMRKLLDNNHSIYALQDPSIENTKIKFNSIEELASIYIHQIKKIQPVGPYNLVGSSFGATMVVEITRQLEEQGDSVNCAALLDGFADFSKAKQRFSSDKSNHLQELQRLMPGDVTVDSPFFDTMCHRLEMLMKYQVPQVKTPLAVFKAQDVLPKFAELSSDDNGWGQYSSHISLYNVPGDHETMLASPNVEVLAKHLNEYIESLESFQVDQLKKVG